MRSALFVGLLAAITLSTPAKAAIVFIDASMGGTVIQSTNCPGPVSCTPNGYKTPLYNVTAGDVIDLGEVALGPAFAGQGRAQFPASYYYQGDLGINWGPLSFNATGPLYSSCFTQGCVPATPPTVFERLLFLVPDGATQLQLGFTGPYSYRPPDFAAAVPEPSTWAMLLIGFAALGFGAYRARPLVERNCGHAS